MRFQTYQLSQILLILLAFGSLTACGPMLNRYIPYEDKVYTDKAESVNAAAKPVTELKIPKQIQHGTRPSQEYVIRHSSRDYQKRDDLILPPE